MIMAGKGPGTSELSRPVCWSLSWQSPTLEIGEELIGLDTQCISPSAGLVLPPHAQPSLPTRATAGSGLVWPWRFPQNQGPRVYGAQSRATKRAQHGQF